MGVEVPRNNFGNEVIGCGTQLSNNDINSQWILWHTLVQSWNHIPFTFLGRTHKSNYNTIHNMSSSEHNHRISVLLMWLVSWWSYWLTQETDNTPSKMWGININIFSLRNNTDVKRSTGIDWRAWSHFPQVLVTQQNVAKNTWAGLNPQ